MFYDDSQVDPAFLQNELASHETVAKRQDARSAKEGEMIVSGTIESFIHAIKDAATDKVTNKDLPYAPDTIKKKGVKDPSQKYNAQIAMNVLPTNIPLIPGTCELPENGVAGWKCLCSLEYFETGADYLRENAARAYKPENFEDEECERIRYYISQDGRLRKDEWYITAPGEPIKVTAPDNEDTPLRKPHPKRSGQRWVQPSTPATFFKVDVKRWINVMLVDVEEDGGAAAPPSSSATPVVPDLTGDPEKDALALAEAETINADASAAAAAAAAAPAAGAGGTKKRTKKVKKITAFKPSFACKAVVVSEDYDPDLSQSERLHENSNYSSHCLVPVMELARKQKQLPSINVSFYVKERFMTPWHPDCPKDMQGVTVLRNMMDKDTKDFMKEFKGEKSATCVIRFSYFQWTGKPNTNERYIVKLIANGDIQWRAYGITNLVHYAMIMSANAVPVHLHAKLWENATINHESNKPQFLEAKEGDRFYKEELANIKGYYVGGTTVVPDFLRYFRGPAGLELTKEFVADEFAFWESDNKKTKKRQFLLKPRNSTTPNPLNAQREHSAVVALGNGWTPKGENGEELGDEYGDNHAYEGNAAIFFEGGFKFYVLLSRPLTDEEKAIWLGKPIDGLLTQLKAENKILYWIYAVKNDAKMAKNFGRAPQIAPPAPPAARPATPKREREEPPPAAQPAAAVPPPPEEEDEEFYQAPHKTSKIVEEDE